MIIRQEESLAWIDLLELQNRVTIGKIIGNYVWSLCMYMVWCTTNLVRYFFDVSLLTFYITIQTYNTQIIDDCKMAWNNF